MTENRFRVFLKQFQKIFKEKVHLGLFYIVLL